MIPAAPGGFPARSPAGEPGIHLRRNVQEWQVFQAIHVHEKNSQFTAARSKIPVERDGKLIISETVIQAGQAVFHGDAGKDLVDVGKTAGREKSAQRHGQRADRY